MSFRHTRFSSIDPGQAKTPEYRVGSVIEDWYGFQIRVTDVTPYEISGVTLNDNEGCWREPNQIARVITY